MCILFLSYEPEPSSRCPYLLVAANNRDEYYHRPTAPARFWERYSQLLAGIKTMIFIAPPPPTEWCVCVHCRQGLGERGGGFWLVAGSLKVWPLFCAH